MKAISKGSLAGCLVHLAAGSTDRFAQQNLQIPEHANNRTISSCLFDARLSARDRLTFSCPDAILITPCPTKKLKSPTTPHLHQVSHPRQASKDVHELKVNMREIHLIDVLQCEGTMCILCQAVASQHHLGCNLH